MTADRAGFAPESIRANLARIHDRIAQAGGDPDRISVLGVTKGFGPDAAVAAVAAGLPSLGESYAQELADKAPAVASAGETPEWHFIGRLQSNKVRLIDDAVSCWQSVDRPSLVAEIAKRVPGARILVQVNAAGEPQKGGCEPDRVEDLVGAAREAGLAVEGLMTIGVDGDDRATRRAFEVVAGMADALALDVRSMGMSADLELAVEAGTTMVRVGSGLFGPRPRP